MSKNQKIGRVRRIIREQIDLPARKIMIEAMVLEISSQALDELGVQWGFNSDKASGGNFVNKKLDGANNSLVLGQIAYPAGSPALSMQPSPMYFMNLIFACKPWWKRGPPKSCPAQVC